jgi:general nucleoside transport system ATP-binding protein
VLAATAISKRFGRTVALDRVDFCARPGEIHALVGENGAGKTTLVNIFAGRLKPDSGAVMLDEVPLRAGSPHLALQAGVAAVYQSPMLFERMTWEENLALGGFGGPAAMLDLDGVAQRARELADSLGFRLPPPGATVEERSVSERVRLEILRALSFRPRVLILDEPTSVLAPSELAAFLEMLRHLRAEGRIVLIVTHKLAEALAVADRVTVLRRGRLVAEKAATATSEAELARLMVGVLAVAPDGTFDRRGSGRTALAVDRLTLVRDGRRILDRIGFTLFAGEIAGIAGVDGNGQTELVEVMAGIRAPTSGSVSVVDAPDIRRDGAMAVIPQNRDLDGLILDMTLWENLMLARAVRRRFVAGGWLKSADAREACDALLRRFEIRTPAGAAAPAAALSGGNRQRLAAARALASSSRVLVAHDISRGLDLRASADVHRMLREFAAAGGAVLLISSDLDELLELCGPLWVMSRGRLFATATRDPEGLGLLMAGAST